MPRQTKWEAKIQEAAYKLFAVPVIYVLGLLVVCAIIQEATGITDLFKWIIFGCGVLGGIIYYFKKHLNEINW